MNSSNVRQNVDEEIRRQEQQYQQPIQQGFRKPLQEAIKTQEEKPRTFFIEIEGEEVMEKVVVSARNIMDAMLKFSQTYYDMLGDARILVMKIEETEIIN